MGNQQNSKGFLQPFKGWKWRKVIGISTLTILGFAIIISIDFFIWNAPKWQTKDIDIENCQYPAQQQFCKDKAATTKDRITTENAVRSTLVQGLGGIFLFVTAYFAWRNVKVAEEKLAKDAATAEANLKITEEKQVTERFTKAIELLGNEKIDVRLGGIYALERIAKDSDKDYWTVIEILTAYVRERSPYPPKEQSNKEYTPFWIENNHPTVKDSQKAIPPITTDIQAVLTVIGRRTKSYKKGEENYLDLNRSNLQGANLYEANLQGARLYEADLQGADLREANLQGADLREANLQGARLVNANLQGAFLERANLQGANLYEANMQGAFLYEANLQEANLYEANLQEANLYKANLQEAFLPPDNLQRAFLYEANLQGANLQGANLQGANLYEANLQGARLYEADLQGANLQGANLYEANLQIANLQGANLNEADLQRADLQGANLQGAKLVKVKNLTIEQLENSKSWQQAKYEPEVHRCLGLLLKQVQNQEQQNQKIGLSSRRVLYPF